MNKNRKVSEQKIISTETIIHFDLEKSIVDYERNLFSRLTRKEYEKCEEILTDFCFELLELQENKHVFINRIFFISIITDIILVYSRKNLLHPNILAHSYKTISTVERWETISEYILHIPWYIDQLKWLLSDHFLVEGNIHVEKALQLINHYLIGDRLTVTWLAEQLGISSTHLSNLFKIQIGETISKYITKRKIEEITYELTYTNESLKTIREKYGFTSHSHFIQSFKKVKGVTPLQYMQNSEK
ncbi:helix-turn-helix transcriptional regulator [Pseudogracilibacillus auburnensis]|uniref:AraC-like DNA-binding protein n=1 Tax=Pseudogracilibacillus auburnensis TaxID=1494959 RepID=A0A2V3W9C6_9BACI|nr:response regulator transcription factor [Pseudogracilibacillus auburnensis]MBO1003348.1 helix-turn-helix transcriptional regulator [Pseudogracilibacillus auburnensis]PXW85349.1 AraC-like DNA-binding protein [Pseudogracilibacillus auburnensis]